MQQKVTQPAIATIALIALVGIIPVLIASAGNAATLENLVMQWIILAAPAAGLAYLLGTGQPRPMLFAISLFTYVWVGLAGLAQITTDTAPWPMLVGDNVTLTAQLIIVISYIATTIGMLTARRTKHTGETERVLASGRLVLITTAVIGTLPLAVGALGGADALLSSRQTVAEVTSSYGSSTLGLVLAMSTIPLFVVFLVWWRRDGLRNIKFSRLVLLLGLLAANALINNPISQPRYWAGTILIAVAMSSPWVRKAGYVRAIAAGAVFAAVVLFPYAAFFRYESGFQRTGGGIVDTLAKSGDYDAFQMISVTVKVSEESHTWGQQILGALFFFIPREVWPDKAINTGEMVAQRFGHSYTNLSSPLWAEMWMDFGWAGVVVAFFGVGVAIVRLDRRFIAGIHAPYFTMSTVLVPILAGYSFIILRGSLLQSMFRLATILAVAWFLSRAKREEPATPERRPASRPSRTPARRT